MQLIPQFVARVQSLRAPGWVRILPLILGIPGIACTLPTDFQTTVPAAQVAAMQELIDAFWPVVEKYMDALDPVPEETQLACDLLNVVYFEGIANGPVTVYWVGGLGWTSYTVDFYGVYDGFAETRLGGASGSPGGVSTGSGGVLSSGRASATFPIDSTVAHAVVDHNGSFKAVVSVAGVTGRYGASCSRKAELTVGVNGLQSTAPTAVPPTAVPPTPVPPSNSSGQRSEEPTPRPTRQPRPTNVPPPTPITGG